MKRSRKNGFVFYSNKSEDDMFAFISIKCKGDTINNTKDIIDAFGFLIDMFQEFEEIKFQTVMTESRLNLKLVRLHMLN